MSSEAFSVMLMGFNVSATHT